MLPNPKQNGVAQVGRCTWYPYYAGFSSAFVGSVLDEIGCDSRTIICDPWNGAGTTTQTAFDRAIPSYGFDLNPVMTRVALARNVVPLNVGMVRRKHDLIVSKYKGYRARTIRPGDPLTNWFCDELVYGIRNLQRAITEVRSAEVVKALFDTAVFRSMSYFSNNLRSSNPTWIRQPSNKLKRIKGDSREFLQVYNETVNSMIDGLSMEELNYPNAKFTAKIQTASARCLPLLDESVQIVLGSPPYCTRIDYAVATSVELAYLGIDINGKDRVFRHGMTGTSTIRKISAVPRSDWGKTCHDFLRSVEKHSSKSSKSYYLKTHIQYYDDLYASLSEIQRVLKVGGSGVLVVQDSFYKEIHNNLPKIVEEMIANLDMFVDRRDDFPVSFDMGRINPLANKKRLDSRPVESVIFFKKL